MLALDDKEEEEEEEGRIFLLGVDKDEAAKGRLGYVIPSPGGGRGKLEVLAIW